MKTELKIISDDLNHGITCEKKARVLLLGLLGVSGSLLKDEQRRIWTELCKGEKDGAFASTLELETDDIYDMIFNGKEIKL